MYFKLKKPNLNKINLSKEILQKQEGEIFDFVKKTLSPKYLCWDKVKYLEPSPKGVSKEQLWVIVKIIRKGQMVNTPIKNFNGGYFGWIKLPGLEEFSHNIDMNTGGELFTFKTEVDKANKQKLITRGIVEEAIASSQLEGANTTRQVAKKMIREGRKPKNQSEQMILNTYETMKLVEENYKDREMSLKMLLELHAMITKNTKISEGEIPRLRKENDKICVSDSEGTIYHEAPDLNFTKKELKKFVDFANDNQDESGFVHPIIKAIMLHFWIGYLHPFTDGNGRVARLAFYWYLLRRGYWAFAYLPISKIIKKSPEQYSMAYIYSEQDEADLTYFVDYNIRKIKIALREFNNYLEKQHRLNKQMNKAAKTKYGLNDRQIQTLRFLRGESGEVTNAKTHMNVFQITKATAIKDLKDLERKKFLCSTKQGRNLYYHATGKVEELF